MSVFVKCKGILSEVTKSSLAKLGLINRASKFLMFVCAELDCEQNKEHHVKSKQLQDENVHGK